MTPERKEEVSVKLKEIIPQGLVSGLGEPVPGSLCVEAAICLAMGEPHSDTPTCVHEIDRSLAIRLNDMAWSSNAVRAEAMLPLALAQLGTAGKDRKAFVSRVVEGTIRKVVPAALRAAAKLNPAHAESLENAAKTCESEGTKQAAYAAAYAASDAARAADARAAARAAYAAADAAAYAAYYAADAAARAAYAASDAARAAYAAYYAADAAADAAAARDKVLKLAVQVVLEAYAAET